jgi:hypothetical protein
MLDREKAAKYLVVAWVKDWTTLTYLRALNVPIYMPINEICNMYPWMPSDQRYYHHKRHIRPLVARFMAPINDFLWDTSDNAQKLKIAKKIENWVSDAYIETNYDTEKRDEKNKAKKELRHERTIQALEIEKRLRASGHHWNICK